MQYFNTDEVVAGAILLLKRKGVFEGWCVLIETNDDGLTVYEGGELLIRQRWLVEWLDVKDVPGFLSAADRITQINNAGKRTHRFIHFISDREEDRHKFPNIMRKESDINMNDDFAGVF